MRHAVIMLLQNQILNVQFYFFTGGFEAAFFATPPVTPPVFGAVLPRPAPVFAAVLAPRPVDVLAPRPAEFADFAAPRVPVTPRLGVEVPRPAVEVVAVLEAPRAVPPPLAFTFPPRDTPVTPDALGGAATICFFTAAGAAGFDGAVIAFGVAVDPDEGL